ncbi:MAG: hypothetical protein ACTMII_02630 [Brachybacterium sp.]
MSASAMQWTTDLELLLDAAPSLEQLPRGHDDALIDLITAMEHGKARLAAVQAQAETVFHDSQIREQKRLGVPRDELGRGIADQIGLARRIAPKQASDELALRRILVTSMPRTTALLGAGKISEWAAHMVAANVVVLDDEDRATIDAEFEARLPKVTAGRASDITRARAMELDPGAAVARNQRAVSGRRVTLRPAVDGMSVLRAVLPVKDGVASFDALTRAAKAAKSGGDPRGKGQIMADTLVERTTGVETVDDVPVEVQLLMTDLTLLGEDVETAWMGGIPIPGPVARDIALGTRTAPSRPQPDVHETPPSELGDELAALALPALPVDDAESRSAHAHPAELAASDGPALAGSPEQPIVPSPPTEVTAEPSTTSPAGLPNEASAGPKNVMPAAPSAGPPEEELETSPPDPATAATDSREVTEAKRWIRRLYTDSPTGDLTEVDGRRRLFRGEVRRFILTRDQRCRTPFCDAAIHDVDHAHRHADGGSTDVGNGVGHCQRFNLAKEMPGWTSTLDPATDEEPGLLTIETPTGHRYTSTSPLLRRLLDGPDGERARILPNAPEESQDAQGQTDAQAQPDVQQRTEDEAPPDFAASR